jgi:hypothetical protein
MADDPASRGEPELLSRAVEFCPEDAARRSCSSRRRVDSDRLHEREIDHQPAVAHGVAGDGVTTSAYRDEQVVLTGKAHSLYDVVSTRTAGDERRMPVDGAVPDAARFVVAFLVRPQECTPEPSPQILDWCPGDGCNFVHCAIPPSFSILPCSSRSLSLMAGLAAREPLSRLDDSLSYLRDNFATETCRIAVKLTLVCSLFCERCYPMLGNILTGGGSPRLYTLRIS